MPPPLYPNGFAYWIRSGAQPTTYDESILALSPAAYWKLNDPSGSRFAQDSSGNGWTASVSGTCKFGVAGPGTGDTAVTIGTNSFITAFGPLDPFQGQDCTIIGWSSTTSAGATAFMLTVGQQSSGEQIQFFNNSTGYITAALYGDGNTGAAPVSSSWAMYAMTYSNATGTVSLYYNGVLNGSPSVYGGGAFSVPSGSQFMIGGLAPAGNGVGPFSWPGSISNVAVFGSALSAAQIANLYSLNDGTVLLPGAPGKVTQTGNFSYWIRGGTVAFPIAISASVSSSVNAMAGVAALTVTAYGPGITAAVPVGAASVTVGAFGASVSSSTSASTNALAGVASLTVTAYGPGVGSAVGLANVTITGQNLTPSIKPTDQTGASVGVAGMSLGTGSTVGSANITVAAPSGSAKVGATDQTGASVTVAGRAPGIGATPSVANVTIVAQNTAASIGVNPTAAGVVVVAFGTGIGSTVQVASVGVIGLAPGVGVTPGTGNVALVALSPGTGLVPITANVVVTGSAPGIGSTPGTANVTVQALITSAIIGAGAQVANVTVTGDDVAARISTIAGLASVAVVAYQAQFKTVIVAIFTASLVHTGWMTDPDGPTTGWTAGTVFFSHGPTRY